MADFFEKQAKEMKKREEKERGIKLYTMDEVKELFFSKVQEAVDEQGVDFSCLWQDPLPKEGGLLKLIPTLLTAINVIMLIALLLRK